MVVLGYSRMCLHECVVYGDDEDLAGVLELWRGDVARNVTARACRSFEEVISRQVVRISTLYNWNGGGVSVARFEISQLVRYLGRERTHSTRLERR